MIVLTMAVLVLMGVGVGATSAERACRDEVKKVEESVPCSYFRQQGRDQIPARCGAP